MIQEIKELRIKIDGLSQLAKELKPISSYTPKFGDAYPDNSKEIKKAYDSLILAKAWLGKVLGELGTESPYTNDGNRKDVKDIEEVVDKAYILESYSEHIGFKSDLSHIEKVDWLREEIKVLFLELQNIELSDLENNISPYLLNNISTYLSESRFWLGFELQRIKENETVN